MRMTASDECTASAAVSWALQRLVMWTLVEVHLLLQTHPPAEEGAVLPWLQVADHSGALTDFRNCERGRHTSLRSSSPAYSPSISSAVRRTAPFRKTSPSSSTSLLDLHQTDQCYKTMQLSREHPQVSRRYQILRIRDSSSDLSILVIRPRDYI